jgi:hypothetical protein
VEVRFLSTAPVSKIAREISREIARYIRCAKDVAGPKPFATGSLNKTVTRLRIIVSVSAARLAVTVSLTSNSLRLQSDGSSPQFSKDVVGTNKCNMRTAV